MKRFVISTKKMTTVLGFALALSLSLAAMSAEAGFNWFASQSSQASQPKIWSSVSEVNNLLWGQDYLCSAIGVSWCGKNYAESKGGTAAGNVYSYIGDTSPDVLIPMNSHVGQMGFSTTYPTNAWFQQAFWGYFRNFDKTDGSDIFYGNHNCVGADWRTCTIKTEDGTYAYNSPIYLFSQPLGVQLAHPQADVNGIYSIGASNAGLNIFGNQKYYISTADLKDDQQNSSEPNCNLGANKGLSFCSTTSVLQSQYAEINVRPAGYYQQPLLSLNSDKNCKKLSDSQYSCSVTWAGNPLKGRKNPVNVYFDAFVHLKDGGTLSLNNFQQAMLPPNLNITIPTSQGHYSTANDDYKVIVQSATFSLEGGNLKLSWQVLIVPKANVDPPIVTSVESSAQTGRFYVFTKGESPAQLIPDAKDKRVGAWSSYFKMPYEINLPNNQKEERSINFELAEGFPFIQFDVKNGAEPAITPLTSGSAATVVWIKNGPGDVSTPDSNGMLGKPIKGGIIVFSTTQAGKTQLIPACEHQGVDKNCDNNPILGYTRYHNAATTNYYAIYVPPCSHWSLGYIKNQNNMAPFANVLHLGPSSGDECSVSSNDSENNANTHFVIAALGANISSNQVAITRAETLAKYAFNYMGSTSVKYTVSKKGLVTTTYHATLLNNGQPVEKIISGTDNGNVVQQPSQLVLGLMPNQQLGQALNYLNFHYAGTLGFTLPFIADCSSGLCSFQTQLQYHGILPYMPLIPTSDLDGKDSHVRQLLQKFVNEYQYQYAYKLYNMQVNQNSPSAMIPMTATIIAKNLPGEPSCTLTAKDNKVTSQCTPGSGLSWQHNAAYFTFKHKDMNTTSLYFYLDLKKDGKLISNNDLEIKGTYNNGSPLQPTYQNNASPAYSNYKYLSLAQVTKPSEEPISNNPGFADTYGGGKRLNQMLQIAPIIKQLQAKGFNIEPNTYNNVLDAAKTMFERYFTGHPIPVYSYHDNVKTDTKNGAYYFAWDKDYNALLGFPESFTSAPQLTDHIFHYGYFVNAAAHIAAHDPDFANQYKSILDYLMFDYAPHHYAGGSLNQAHPLPVATATLDGNQCDNDKCYYDMGSWDAYLGRAWATGINTSMNGPNLESSSEQINAYAAMILWGAVTHQSAVMNEGIYLYTTAVHSAQTYWFGHGNGMNIDTHATNQKILLDDNYPSKYSDDPDFKGNSAVVYQAGLGTSFFGRQAYYGLGIQVIPVTGASMYLGKYKNDVNKNFDAVNYLLQNWELDPRFVPDGESGRHWLAHGNNNTFQVLLAEYAALGGAPVTDATTGEINHTYWNPDSPYCMAKWGVQPTTVAGTNTNGGGNKCMDGGETRLHAYTWIRDLHDYGLPKYVNAPTYNSGAIDPLYAVFDKDGTLTHVVYNAMSTTQTITFEDGTMCDNVAPNTLEVCKHKDIQPLKKLHYISWSGKASGSANVDENGNGTGSFDANAIDSYKNEVTYTASVTGAGSVTIDSTGHFTLSGITSDNETVTITAHAKDSPDVMGAPITITKNQQLKKLHYITWSGKTSGSANVDENDNGSGSFDANAIDSYKNEVTYTASVTGAGSVTIDSAGHFTLSGITSDNETVTITAHAKDSPDVMGAPITITKNQQLKKLHYITWSGKTSGSANVDVNGNGSGSYDANAIDSYKNEVTYTASVSGAGSASADSAGNITLSNIKGDNETVTITAQAKDSPNVVGKPIQIKKSAALQPPTITRALRSFPKSLIIVHFTKPAGEEDYVYTPNVNGEAWPKGQFSVKGDEAKIYGTSPNPYTTVSITVTRKSDKAHATSASVYPTP